MNATKPSSETVTLINGMPGPITLMLESHQTAPGLSIELTKTKLDAGEKAPVLRLAFKPSGITPPAFPVTLRVDQTGQRFQVLLRFSDAK